MGPGVKEPQRIGPVGQRPDTLGCWRLVKYYPTAVRSAEGDYLGWATYLGSIRVLSTDSLAVPLVRTKEEAMLQTPTKQF